MIDLAEALDRAVIDPRFLPYYGWHDNHRAADRTAEYRPAIQQNFEEFVSFARTLVDLKVNNRCLQLGLGYPGGAHAAFSTFCQEVWSVDDSPALVERYRALFPEATLIAGNTRNAETIKTAGTRAPYDVLFIDAGHKLADVAHDFRAYGRMVRTGGVIAFHDALKRPTYESEIEVWAFLDRLRADGVDVHMIGSELGIAWIEVV